MRILISNDDGIQSEGIAALSKAAEKFGEVTVVAPHRERSTAGHSLTLHKPLRIAHLSGNMYSTTGTPADCIYLGIREILKAEPDLILSGINAGANLGTDVHYSGTVAAAREGALMNIRSIAFSLVANPSTPPKLPQDSLRFGEAAAIAADVLEKVLTIPFPSHTLLNVNIPSLPRNQVKGIAVARQGFRYYSNEVLCRQDPRGKNYYWIGGAYSGFEQSADSDCRAVMDGKVAVTPITIDCTHQEFYRDLKGRW